ncbi:MAG: hypothetical protein ANIMEMIM_00285 [Candidatus Argoarchaeum ethanivorans]|uniref:Uncharacterized protein n=1 Tax=Candidatus Argoarchaeum ethanivorans TaxID=2608793 RepID=A0A811T8P0_9EURY|nr:MAG: hypothetical protein ANIMEMIM_00285 [Candidatus Argoarchaeum ethanivorans]
MNITPNAIPTAHKIPIAVSSGNFVFLLIIPIPRAEAIAKNKAPIIGLIPRKKLKPTPPNAV